jgi:hypothetical protein
MPASLLFAPGRPTNIENVVRQILVKSGVNCFNQHIVGLSEFHATLSTIILYFGSNIGYGLCRGEISLIRRCGRLISCFTF